MSTIKSIIWILFIHKFLYHQVITQVLHYSYKEVISSEYKCDFLFISLKDSFENATELSTSHLFDKTDDDVQSIEFRHGAFSFTFPTFICDKFKNLRYIDMAKGFVSKIGEKDLENCTNLERLCLNAISEETLWENFFEHNTKLSSLKLFSISLKTLDRNFLANVNETLTDLELSISADSFTFPSDFLSSLLNLRTLKLGIQELTDLPSTLFENSVKLEVIAMSYCNITDLPKGIFKSLRNLLDLDLSGNKLQTIHSDSFGSHPSLMTVDLSSNPITAIDPKFYQLPSLLYITLPRECGDSIVVDDHLNGTKIKKKSDKCTASYKPRD
ncbi:protein toll-like [Chironomus tepperi]|uniref:protein toll-like n=1 Tax=Chironomus tepperi TaxID=113505 RepID=UPI00391F0039